MVATSFYVRPPLAAAYADCSLAHRARVTSVPGPFAFDLLLACVSERDVN